MHSSLERGFAAIRSWRHELLVATLRRNIFSANIFSLSLLSGVFSLCSSDECKCNMWWNNNVYRIKHESLEYSWKKLLKYFSTHELSRQMVLFLRNYSFKLQFSWLILSFFGFFLLVVFIKNASHYRVRAWKGQEDFCSYLWHLSIRKKGGLHLTRHPFQSIFNHIWSSTNMKVFQNIVPITYRIPQIASW